MTPEEIKIIIREELGNFIFSDRFVFFKKLQILDGRNIQIGQTTGTMIGLDATSKLSICGATPVARQSHVANPSNVGGTYTQSEVQSIVTAVNSILVILETFGLNKTS